MMTTSPRFRKLPITFGELPVQAVAVPRVRRRDDLRLFLLTFAGGFLFTALFIA